MTKAEAKRIKAARSLEELHRMADAVLSRARKASARHAPSRKAKEGKRAERNERAAEIRDAVFKRANGVCECCGSRTPAEWHHLISGPSRRKSEAVETTAAVCVFCHLDLHRSKFHALLAMRLWAKTHGYEDAIAALTRRIAKVVEAGARTARRTA